MKETYFETLSDTDISDNFFDLRALVQCRARHNFPVIEDGLREGLSLSVRSQIGGETEGLHDRKVCLDSEHRCTRPLFFGEHLTTTLVEYGVDTSDGVLRTLDFH
jgi:hypothetical protein